MCIRATACLCLLFASACTTTEAIKANKQWGEPEPGLGLEGVGGVFLLTSQSPPPSVETGGALMQGFVNPAPLPALFSNLCSSSSSSSSLPPLYLSPPPPPPFARLLYEADRFHSSCLTFMKSLWVGRGVAPGDVGHDERA